MTAGNRRSNVQTTIRCAMIGLAASGLLTLVALFVPLPAPAARTILAIQIVGVWAEISRATPYHASTWNAFLINAAVYAVTAGIAVLISRWRKSTLSVSGMS